MTLHFTSVSKLTYCPDTRRTPALEESWFGVFCSLETLDVGGHIVIQPGYVDTEIGGSIGFDFHEPLGQQIDGPLSIATIQAEVKTGRKADEAFVKGFLLPFCFLPEYFERLVTLEVLPTIEQRNSVFQRCVHSSTHILVDSCIIATPY